MALWIDRLCAGLLVLVGCVHNFLAAPRMYDAFTEDALWFTAGGVSLWFAGLINFVWLRNAASRRELWWAALSANLVMAALLGAFVMLMGGFGEPQGVALVAVVGWLTLRSLPFRRLRA